MDEQEMTSWGEKISNRVEALPKDRRMMLARYMDILSRCMAAEDGCRAVIIMETEDTIALGAVNVARTTTIKRTVKTDFLAVISVYLLSCTKTTRLDTHHLEDLGID